jgi:hypothetical protein
MTIIKQGGHSITGRWLKDAWFVQSPGVAVKHFVRLTDAMEFAKLRGASGEWERSSEKTGPRGSVRVVYTEKR